MGKHQDNKILELRYARTLIQKSRVERLICYRCQGKIRVGSRVHVRHSNFLPNSFRVYHQSCWEELFIVC